MRTPVYSLEPSRTNPLLILICCKILYSYSRIERDVHRGRTPHTNACDTDLPRPRAARTRDSASAGRTAGVETLSLSSRHAHAIVPLLPLAPASRPRLPAARRAVKCWPPSNSRSGCDNKGLAMSHEGDLDTSRIGLVPDKLAFTMHLSGRCRAGGGECWN